LKHLKHGLIKNILPRHTDSNEVTPRKAGDADNPAAGAERVYDFNVLGAQAYNAGRMILCHARRIGGMSLGCKQRNHFRFLQSLQRYRSEFRQTDGINPFVQRLMMAGDGFRQNGAINIYRSNLRGKRRCKW
jgi:hypothetical protein